MSSVDRRDYTGEGLSEDDLAATPWEQARQWVDEADRRGAERDDVPEPRALSVATVDAAGAPNVRTVLMRFFDERGPGFVTHLESAKGLELGRDARVAAALTWPAMFRAIRFRGVAEALDVAEVASYWASRPWASRISAWASQQSRPAAGRGQLEADFDRYAARFPDHGEAADVPVPPTWGGFRVRASEVEFWAGRRNRLHDRLLFTARAQADPSSRGAGARPRLDDAAAWSVTRLQP